MRNLQKKLEVLNHNDRLAKNVCDTIADTKCGICRKKVDYTILSSQSNLRICYYDTAFQGKRMIICKGCYNITLFLGDIVFRIARLIKSIIR